MTEQQKKSRRRFLADLLFMGGGVTAAALLTKSLAAGGEPDAQLSPIPETTPQLEPQPAGGVDIPEEPMIEGDMVMPEHLEPVVEGRAAPPDIEPQMDGLMELPVPDCRIPE